MDDVKTMVFDNQKATTNRDAIRLKEAVLIGVAELVQVILQQQPNSDAARKLALNAYELALREGLGDDFFRSYSYMDQKLVQERNKKEGRERDYYEARANAALPERSPTSKDGPEGIKSWVIASRDFVYLNKAKKIIEHQDKKGFQEGQILGFTPRAFKKLTRLYALSIKNDYPYTFDYLDSIGSIVFSEHLFMPYQRAVTQAEENKYLPRFFKSMLLKHRKRKLNLLENQFTNISDQSTEIRSHRRNKFLSEHPQVVERREEPVLPFLPQLDSRNYFPQKEKPVEGAAFVAAAIARGQKTP